MVLCRSQVSMQVRLSTPVEGGGWGWQCHLSPETWSAGHEGVRVDDPVAGDCPWFLGEVPTKHA